MMNPKKNRGLVITFVVVMIVGLTMVYVPLLFAPSPEQIPKSPEPSREAAFLPALNLGTSTPTTSPSAKKPSLPQGFSDLEKENQSLKDLEDLLEKP